MNLLTPATVRWLALALCAAALLIEHVRLAVRARHGAGAGRVALALAVPGAGALFAWRKGERVAPVLYGALAAAYLLLLCWP